MDGHGSGKISPLEERQPVYVLDTKDLRILADALSHAQGQILDMLGGLPGTVLVREKTDPPNTEVKKVFEVLDELRGLYGYPSYRDVPRYIRISRSTTSALMDFLLDYGIMLNEKARGGAVA